MTGTGIEARQEGGGLYVLPETATLYQQDTSALTKKTQDHFEDIKTKVRELAKKLTPENMKEIRDALLTLAST